MTTKRKTPADLWATLQKAAAEDDLEEILAMSDAEIDKEIADNGGDPGAIRARGVALAKSLGAPSETPAWQVEARQQLDRDRALAAEHASARAKLSRREMIARIKVARSDPRDAVAALFRGRKGEDASTDEELARLLADIELLELLERQKKGGAGRGEK